MGIPYPWLHRPDLMNFEEIENISDLRNYTDDEVNTKAGQDSKCNPIIQCAIMGLAQIENSKAEMY